MGAEADRQVTEEDVAGIKMDVGKREGADVEVAAALHMIKLPTRLFRLTLPKLPLWQAQMPLVAREEVQGGQEGTSSDEAPRIEELSAQRPERLVEG